MPAYSYSQTIEMPQPDTTMAMELWVTASPEDIEAANGLLLRLREAVKKGSPFPAEFEDISESLDAWEAELPEFDFSNCIKIEAMDLNQLPSVIESLCILHTKIPELGYKGEAWMIKRIGWNRVVYEIIATPGAESVEIQQRYLENQPYHHKPAVIGYFD